MPTSTLGAVWGPVSCPRTLWHAGGIEPGDLTITRTFQIQKTTISLMTYAKATLWMPSRGDCLKMCTIISIFKHQSRLAPHRNSWLFAPAVGPLRHLPNVVLRGSGGAGRHSPCCCLEQAGESWAVQAEIRENLLKSGAINRQKERSNPLHNVNLTWVRHTCPPTRWWIEDSFTVNFLLSWK